MKARRRVKVAWASVKLVARLTWVLAVTAAEFLMFPLLWPFYLLRRAHRRYHEEEQPQDRGRS
jgi:hypothetical protein